jgi:hypothetical protein
MGLGSVSGIGVHAARATLARTIRSFGRASQAEVPAFENAFCSADVVFGARCFRCAPELARSQQGSLAPGDALAFGKLRSFLSQACRGNLL